MKKLEKISRFVPYLYFLVLIAYGFTQMNRTDGILAYPFLLAAIPFVVQIIRPRKALNLTLGITTVCISSYLIIAYLADLAQILVINEKVKQLLLLGGGLVVLNFLMSMWLVRNSLRRES